MYDEIFLRAPWLLIPLLALVGVALTGITWIVSAYWRSVQVMDIEAKLKQDMLHRGFSPAQIERVLRASARSTDPGPAAASMPINNEFALAKKLLDDGYPLEDIERLLRTLHHDGRENVVNQI